MSYAATIEGRLMRNLSLGLEAMTGRRRLERLYRDYKADPARGDFFAEAIARMEIVIAARNVAQIPREGALAVVANHPYGAMDGIALACLMSRVRGDVMIIAHAALARVPELAERLFAIDFSGSRVAERANVQARAGALAHLKRGGCLLVFPAGAVMTTPHAFARRAVEWNWGPLSARLIMRSGARVLPVYVPGQNSRLFQVASHLSQSLRYALLFHEAARMIGGRIDLHVGRVIEPQAITGFSDAIALTDWLRWQVFSLASTRRPETGDPLIQMFEDAACETGVMSAI
ncbi:1-acyl-sn-glycerol-3-phosphate acyltransferase [Jiella sp. MQZ9-1]|uniref:1-acyl-sn-glycerol-3-phosphate acyltransferase n=1 Tax=Jiella flava TaxID=2816857 RepID=A0A939FZJ9_9HYPH|nr:1-acyl-sn-glycerol-3-phosphate acyltransferase [Jiella flava]MBO0664392.1 1-acyl-sn-glycerol-3-phosphate acyltransferase [Jiella flava]MCD2473027.1 1-acyl-sn-glycerol-3-phosphate acyltransferase [Jiella flava]